MQSSTRVLLRLTLLLPIATLALIALLAFVISLVIEAARDNPRREDSRYTKIQSPRTLRSVGMTAPLHNEA